MKYYFKVVTDKLKSYTDNFREINESEYPVQYKLNDYVKPNIQGSKLYVFDNFDSAKNFAYTNRYSSNYPLLIYLCIVENPKVCTGIGDINYAGSLTNIMNIFWRANTDKSVRYINTKNPPSNTIECDSVCLLAKLDWK